MNLKRLELRGFKTFAHPTELVFPSGITALVGPNGSGKSNVADALRWVLGEQSLRAVRGKRTEDVIFAGSSAKPPAGMAEVSLTLDNSSGWLPIAFAEVRISRRAYRSGENEYLINGTKVRLRDLHELLLKVGLADSAYAVIGQGAVDLALSLRPEERRVLLDEAADVRRFQAKLQETRDKLGATEQSLVRARDLIAELAPRLTSLAEQAARLRQHQQLTAEWGDLQRRWYRRLRDQLAAKLADAAGRHDAVLQEAADCRLRLDRCGQQLATLDDERVASRQEIESLEREAARWQREAEELRRRTAVLGERRQAQLRRQDELKAELAVAQQSLAAAQRAALETEEACAALEIDVAARREALAKDEQRHAAELDRQRALERSIHERREELARLRERIAALRDQRGVLAERRQAAVMEHARRAEASATAKVRLAQALSRADKLRDMLGEAKSRLGTLQAEAAQVAVQISAAEEALQQLASRSRQASRMLDERRAQMAVLERWRDSYAAFPAGVRAVLQAATAAPGRPRALSGIIGVVADLLRVPEPLETAIEVALGGRAQDIVVERWSDAEAGIALLKHLGAGRATFLPLDTLRIPGRSGTPLVLREPGVLGLAAELVQVERRYQSVVELVLGRTLVAHDLPAARRVLSLSPPGWQIVTVDGEIVRTTGAVTGGARKGAEVGLLARQRELRTLCQKVATLEREDAVLAAQLAEQREAQAARRRQHTELEDRCREEDAAVRRGETALAAALAEVRLLTDEERQATLAAARQAEERDKLEGQLAAAGKELAELERSGQGLEARLDRLESEQRNQATEQRAVAEELAAQRTALAVKEGELAGRHELLATQRVALAQASVLVAERQTNMATLENEGQLVATELRTADEALAAAERELGRIHAAKAPARGRLSELDSRRRSVEEDSAVQRERLAALEAECRETLAALSRLREQAEQARQQAAEELGDAVAAELWDGSSPGAHGDEVPPEELKRQIDRVRAALRHLGMVNPAAINEYEETLARHEFLVGQVTDMEEAARSLQRLAAELQKTTRRRFEETFRAVGSEFRRYFTRLFGGGTARLVLTDPDDIEQTGVEIVAQPPGRRQQHLALLSGGERALTAVALLFAVLSVRPIAFCVLDEVDAALDEANVGRFGEALRELAQRTQFVVVTHNRATMQAADSLYGVSMAEDSVSQVISLRLADNGEKEDWPYVRPAATHR